MSNGGEFPIKRASILPTGQGPAVEQTYSGAQEWNAIAGIGQEIFALGVKQQDASDRMELSTLKRKTEELNNAAYMEMSKETDPEKRKKIWEKSREDQNSLTSNRKSVNRKLQIWKNSVQPQWDRFTYDLNQSMVKDEAKSELDLNALDLLETNDLEGHKELLDDGLETGILTKAEYDYRLKNAPVNAKFSQARVLMDSNPDMAIQILENTPDLNGDQLDQKDKLVTHALALQNQKYCADKQKMDEEYLMLFSKMEKGEPVTWDEVKATSLPATGALGKTNLWNRYKRQEAQKAAGQRSAIEEGDPVMNARMQSIVDLRPEKLTEEHLYAAVNKGLGTNKVAGLVTRLRKNQKGKEVLQKYRSQLSKLHTSGLFGKVDKRGTSDIYLDLSRKLDTYLSTKPSDAEAGKFFERLIREDVRIFGYLPKNELPGFDDNPISFEYKNPKTNEVFSANVRFGDVVVFNGVKQQAVGRNKDGLIIWRKVETQ